MMQKLWRCLYLLLGLPVLVGLVRVLAYKNEKLRLSWAGRLGWWERWVEQLKQRVWHKPLIWFHVSSAGEFLQAQPVMERCLSQGLQCAITFTSVTGYRWSQRSKFAENQRPILLDYLPLDFPYNVRRCLALLQPSVILYVKFDLWPNLIWEAHAQKIPQYLISATLQPRSLRWTNVFGRSLYRTLYACLDGIFTVSAEDQERFLTTNPTHPNIQNLGDTRFDSVIDRRQRIPQPKLPDYVQQHFVLIAGSTWPPDENCIFPALKEALAQFTELLLILVPHEPTADHLQHEAEYFQEYAPLRWSQLSSAPTHTRVILIDTVGILSSLYYVGHLAYIGGAFTTGVHNTMEPCAMGVPVIFGPKHYNAPEALQLLQAKLAFTIRTPAEFRQVLFALLQDQAHCKQLGKQARAMIESQAGAAERCFAFIMEKCNENPLS